MAADRHPMLGMWQLAGGRGTAGPQPVEFGTTSGLVHIGSLCQGAIDILHQGFIN